jgi:hypothetical protein
VRSARKRKLAARSNFGKVNVEQLTTSRFTIWGKLTTAVELTAAGVRPVGCT